MIPFFILIYIVIGSFGSSALATDFDDDATTEQNIVAEPEVVVVDEDNIENMTKIDEDGAENMQQDSVVEPLQSDEPFLSDTIEAVVYGTDGAEIITKSDVDHPVIGGGIRTLDDIVFERLIFLDAKKHKIFPEEDLIDRYLLSLQRQNNLSEQDLIDIFAAAGYTLKEGREQFGMMQVINTMLDFKIRSNLIVSKKAVEEYYAQHPVVESASYTLERAFVPFDDHKTKKKQRKELTHFAKTGRGISGISWTEPFTLMAADLAENIQFITSMKAGQIAVIENAGGFDLFKLVSIKPERLLSFEERYQEIADILRQPLYEEMMKAYKETLFDTTAILYFE